MKHCVRIFTATFVATILFTATAPAQSPTPNIALSAVCTHSGGGSGSYAPSNYNDGVIAPAGSRPWGWTSGGSTTGTGNWIMFEWHNPETFGEVALYHAEINRRYLTGGTIQIWDDASSQWIDHSSWLNPAPYTNFLQVIQFPPATTTRMRITRWVMAPVGQTTNPNFREIEIRNICTDPPTTVSFEAPVTTSQPAPIRIDYSIGRPMGDFTASMSFEFYTTDMNFVYSEKTSVEIHANTVNGTYLIPSDVLQPGYYILKVVFHVLDICNSYTDMEQQAVIMVVPPGQTACQVWPGDVNNDGIVNYGDHKALITYIHKADLNPQWLNGPARYRIDQKQDPLTFIRWEVQPSVPWFTPEGCYMDADGNGTINAFDDQVIKINWMQQHGASPKSDDNQYVPEMFDMRQNFPNPFGFATGSSSTLITYSIPERSEVTITVVDLLGRKVATLVNSELEPGIRTAQFDGSDLQSGTYMAMATMRGLHTGQVFTRTIRMTLRK